MATACPGGDDEASPPPPATPSGPPPAGTIRLAYPAEPPTLDPVAATGGSAATRDILRPVLPALFRLDATSRPQPELAAAWPTATDIALDPFSVRLRLREASWSDGTPITADDVRFSWERLREGPTGLRYRQLRDVEVVSPRELVLRFDATVRRWWALFSVDDMILPAHAHTPDWGGGPTISGGPFVFDGWTPGLSVRLRRNASWWGPPTGAEAVEVLFVPDDEMRLQLLERGEVDVAYAPGEANWGHRARVRGLEATGGALEAGGASGAWGPSWWELDADLDRLGDRRALAAAVSAAVDRSLAVEVLEDSGQRMDGIPHRFPAPRPRDLVDGTPALSGPWPAPDLARARTILREGGFTERGGVLRRGSGGAQEVLLAYAEGSGTAASLARMIHFQVRPLGLRVELVAVPADRLEREWIPDRRADLYLLLRRGADAPDATVYRSDAPGPGRSPDTDEAVDRARTAVAAARLDGRVVTGTARGAWTTVQETLLRTGAVVPLARVRTWIVARPPVSGPWATGTAAGPLWNAEDWRIEG